MTQLPRSKSFSFIAFLFLAGAAVGIFFQFYFHKFMNVDTLSYINIAELYAKGEWSLAINGCWSPLYSWILAILMKPGIDPLAACYLLNFISAATCVYFLFHISKRLLTDPVIFILFNLFSVFYFLNQSLSALTPDLMATAITLFFFDILLRDIYANSFRLQLFAGVVAAFMYFAKSYNFLFVTAFLFLLIVISFIGRKKKEPKYRALFNTWLVFITISLLWIIPLSIHEKQITFSTAGRYVYNFVHPDNNDHPASLHIIPPPYPEAYSAWINPVHHLDSMTWSPFQSRRMFHHQVQLIQQSISSLIVITDKRLLKFSIMMVILIICFFSGKVRASINRSDLSLILIAMILYPVGYLPIFVFERYVLISVVFYHLLFFTWYRHCWFLLPLINVNIYFSALPC
ncbi:MAG TPA: glycosyltransferase family 39 protein [Flavitalea sp.]|nr:glycosyltransferase family 39 protein [Flavitalea sp.]